MSFLTSVQKFLSRQGLRRQNSVFSSQDQTALQVASLANQILQELVDRWTFQTLVKEALFTSVSGEDQGTIQSLAPEGFLRIIDETIYDRTQAIQIFGPIGPQAWQQSKAFIPIGPLYRYRIRGDHLLFNPDNNIGGHTCAFEYASSWCVYNATDDVYKSQFTKDDDTFLLDEKLLLLGLQWLWKETKGAPYAETFRMWEEACTTAAGRSGTKPRIIMDDSNVEVQPYLIVAPGSWPL